MMASGPAKTASRGCPHRCPTGRHPARFTPGSKSCVLHQRPRKSRNSSGRLPLPMKPIPHRARARERRQRRNMRLREAVAAGHLGQRTPPLRPTSAHAAMHPSTMSGPEMRCAVTRSAQLAMPYAVHLLLRDATMSANFRSSKSSKSTSSAAARTSFHPSSVQSSTTSTWVFRPPRRGQRYERAREGRSCGICPQQGTPAVGARSRGHVLTRDGRGRRATAHPRPSPAP